MWIAKNCITGKTYGKKFSSIYDCQSFIDKDLCFLQYEWKQLKSMEESYEKEIDYQKWYKEHYHESCSFVSEICGRLQYAIDSIVSSKSFEGAHGQNVIRCWYVEQNRFADGMDF